MRKLRLNSDDLVVESFKIPGRRIESGTVEAYEDCEMTRCGCPTAGQCSNYCTDVEDYTCLNSCWCGTAAGENTCYNTCYRGLTCPGGGCGAGTNFGGTCYIGCGGDGGANESDNNCATLTT